MSIRVGIIFGILLEDNDDFLEGYVRYFTSVGDFHNFLNTMRAEGKRVVTYKQVTPDKSSSPYDYVVYISMTKIDTGIGNEPTR